MARLGVHGSPHSPHRIRVHWSPSTTSEPKLSSSGPPKPNPATFFTPVDEVKQVIPVLKRDSTASSPSGKKSFRALGGDLSLWLLAGLKRRSERTAGQIRVEALKRARPQQEQEHQEEEEEQQQQQPPLFIIQGFWFCFVLFFRFFFFFFVMMPHRRDGSFCCMWEYYIPLS